MLSLQSLNKRLRPTDIGRRLLPHVIDETARLEPEAVYTEYPISPTDATAGTRTVTYRQFANSINGVAWWLEREIGKGNIHETLAYVGPNDLRYFILAVGAVKAGYKMLFTSPRNSLLAHINLFESQDCHTIIITNPPLPPATNIITACDMHVLWIPGLEELLTGSHAHYPYTKSFEEAKDDPLVCLHTSGTTGLPKPRVLSHGYCAALEMMCRSPGSGEYESVHERYQGTRFFSAMPAFHAAGILMSLATAVFTRTIIIWPPPGPLSLDAILGTLEMAKAETAFLPPSILEDISKQPTLLSKLSSVRHVMYAGGALPKIAGDIIASKTTLWTILGTTEIGYLPILDVGRDDWAYIHPNSTSSTEFRHKADDLYELVLMNNPKLRDHLPVFQLFPELQEYSTSDLFSPHPTKPDLWTHRGRADDIIVFVNGEKTNPITMELQIQSHPLVRTALVVGEGRFEAALLIEPIQDVQLSVHEKAKLIENLWPVVEQANRDCPAHARVFKSHILFVNPEKPMAKAGKGTVQRKATLELYANEIDKLYTDADVLGALNSIASPIDIDLRDMKAVRSCVRQVVCHVTSWERLAEDDELFGKGLDSLQVIQIVRYLKASLVAAGTDAKGLAPSTVYTNSSVSKLAAVVMAMGHQAEFKEETEEKTREIVITEMLETYFKPLTKVPSSLQKSQIDQEPREVILTGSTGMLGSYILEALIASPAISKIYCLNRSDNSEKRQAQMNKTRGLGTNFDSSHVTFLSADFSKPGLGLDDEQYTLLLSTTSLIIHNAWLVDFNLALPAFSNTHIAGVHHLINFSLASSHLAKIFFISSIGSVTNYPLNHPSTLVPEAIISDPTVPSPMGYAESKHVAERLLAHASTTLSTPVSIVRVGQIAGPVRFRGGVWNKAEWLPSLVLSSKHLSLLPDSLGRMDTIDWIPVDLLSPILIELALRSDVQGATAASEAVVYHAVNPRTTTWAALLPVVQKALGPGIEVVSLETWVSALRDSASAEATRESVARNPAVKLLEFYDGLRGAEGAAPFARLATEKTESASESLRELEAVRGKWMTDWVERWLG